MKCSLAKKLGIPLMEDIVIKEEEEKGLNLPTDKGELKKMYGDVCALISKHGMDLQLEEDKRKKWHEENGRRKHNYLAFIFELLKILASKGKMPGLLEKAKEEYKKKKEAKKKEKEAKEAKETKEVKKEAKGA